MLRYATVLPFTCLFWAGLVFICQAVVNEEVFHRDMGLGDSFRCPLPDGYELNFIDTTDVAYVSNTRGATVLDNVRLAQLSGPFILAASDSKAFAQVEQQSYGVDSFYLLDTRDGHQERFNDETSFRKAARKLDINLQLLAVGDLYSTYRFTWFDVLAGVLLIALPLLGVGFLVGWTLKVRRSPIFA